jgi:hypothetical protein
VSGKTAGNNLKITGLCNIIAPRIKEVALHYLFGGIGNGTITAQVVGVDVVEAIGKHTLLRFYAANIIAFFCGKINTFLS